MSFLQKSGYGFGPSNQFNEGDYIRFSESALKGNDANLVIFKLQRVLLIYDHNEGLVQSLILETNLSSKYNK